MAHRHIVVFALACAAVLPLTRAQAKAPAKVIDELSRTTVTHVVTRAGDLPQPVRAALARAFQQRTLEIADAGQPYQTTDFVIVHSGVKQLPRRRLIFAFPTRSYYVVYYQALSAGHSVDALIFSAPVRGSSRFVWGGVERDYEKPANTPAALIRRIASNKLFDHLPFLW